MKAFILLCLPADVPWEHSLYFDPVSIRQPSDLGFGPQKRTGCPLVQLYARTREDLLGCCGYVKRKFVIYKFWRFLSINRLRNI